MSHKTAEGLVHGIAECPGMALVGKSLHQINIVLVCVFWIWTNVASLNTKREWYFGQDSPQYWCLCTVRMLSLFTNVPKSTCFHITSIGLLLLRQKLVTQVRCTQTAELFFDRKTEILIPGLIFHELYPVGKVVRRWEILSHRSMG